MRVLLDTCVWGNAISDIEHAGHQVEWVGNWSDDPGDQEILEIARQRGSVLITLDKDFGELAVLRSQAHCGIIRLVAISARAQGETVVQVLRTYGDELTSGALVTVDSRRVRIRQPFG